ncbi:MAG: hypothetical protein HRU46_10645 [Verrucomicrobiales bacterium]|nr:hypothetical protein [Verrucomicrobiales bacterium]
MITVPVNLGETMQGLARSEGMLELHNDALVLQIQSTDTVLEVIKSPVKSIRIPLESIEKATFKKGWFGARMELRLTDLKLLSKIPSAREGIVTLKVARRHRVDAEELYALCNHKITDLRLQKVSDLMES